MPFSHSSSTLYSPIGAVLGGFAGAASAYFVAEEVPKLFFGTGAIDPSEANGAFLQWWREKNSEE